ncbi:MAG: alanine--tRNA ligase-related protein [Candidatus Nanoarchaeia archaeon]|nr:alanine--tRNA ligase-related protein [Candidatus Nanoarchaeia archaeon]MDD5587982.1 alanine--tRNA ligase-related protein [Candidatus Nanoarchaeia archaeon]
MKAHELKQKYLEFFKSKGHAIIKSASLIPEFDPTVLFTTAGMHPLVPFLMGQKHPLGKRLADVQKCIRTGDIDSVGDPAHLTFFEMLGNWSLGDYFKKEAIEYSFEFLTKVLKFDKNLLSVTVFAGDKDAPKDEESAKTWQSLGIPKERIYFLPKVDNWWGPAGTTGPCGPCTEMFIDTGKEKCSKNCKPGCSCGKFIEIWNDVFMGYKKDKRLILVDGMYCLYDDKFNLNKELLDTINNFNSHSILVVNKFKEKGLKLVQNYNPELDTNWQAFSLEEKGIKKDNPEYFNTLLKTFDLQPEEVIYFDHDEKNIETAAKLGILSKHYTDIKSIKKVIEDHLIAFIPLKQKNVDTGMGVERTSAMLEGKKNVYETELFLPLIEEIKKLAKLKSISKENEKSVRIISDHMRAATFILGDERDVLPSNVDQGYILRRFIRRAIRHGNLLGIKDNLTKPIAKIVIEMYKEDYPELKQKYNFIMKELENEEVRFRETLEKGIKQFEKISDKNISGKDAFLLFQSYGFPLEMVQELAKEKGIDVDEKGFNKEFEKHQELSRVGAEKKFKGGLSEASEITAKLHTATHLLNEALRRILSKEIKQKGSNITPERLRFDFNFDRKLTDEEVKKVEDEVNKVINKKLDIIREEMPLDRAIKSGAQHEFGAKYPEKVSVYSIGDYSKEICMGPHVKNTKELGKFKIIKEESIAAGIRRIKAILE